MKYQLVKHYKRANQNMSVVNCKVKYIRPHYQNLKEWMQDPNNVYVGRRGVVFIDKKRFPEQASELANPFKIKNSTRQEVIAKYEQYIRERLQKEPELVRKLLALKGKNLGCWCHPEPCHADVLLKLIGEYDQTTCPSQPIMIGKT